MNTTNRKLEICCYTVESALIAEQAGADRIELCDNYFEGGTTPSFAAIKYAVDQLKIPVNVIVRPRGGDFLYSDIEYAIIKNDVIQAKALGAHGVVIGFLTADAAVDMERTREIVQMAGSMEVTFHRAFDMCRDPFRALDCLKESGVTRILTSGGQATAVQGTGLLSELTALAGDDVIIMPGSGITAENLNELMQRTGAREFHSSAKVFVPGYMNYINNAVLMGAGTNENLKISVSSKTISRMRKILDDFQVDSSL